MFNVPTKIHYGAGALKHIGDYGLKSLCIIADPFLLKTDVFLKGLDLIKQLNIEYEIFSDIVPDAPLEKITEGVGRLEENSHEAILAIGGGSALDTAKAIGFFHGKIYPRMNRVKVFCVPTTSGTGSEVTSYAVVKDTKTGIKYPLSDEGLLPDVAILDTDFVKSMPRSVTVDTGMDALTHGIEGYLAKGADCFTDLFAKEAIRRVWGNLPKAAKDPDEQTRENLHVAACMAGIAFERAGLGINHSLAHIVGARFHLPHGRANAILLPYVMAYHYEHGQKARYAELAEFLGCSGFSEDLKCRNFIRDVVKLKEELGVPVSFEKAGVDKDEFFKELEEMAEIAEKDTCTTTNPIPVPPKDLQEILTKVYYGKDPLK